MDMFSSGGMGLLQPESLTSSPESLDVEDESSRRLSSGWAAPEDPPPAGTTSTSLQQPRANAPLQKRRRVTRACDECRRKKIKCDGKQPCTHCTVYSYDCTYDQPSNRRRNPAPQYIEMMEHRLLRMETLLKTYIPNIELNDSNLEGLIQQQQGNRGPPTLKIEPGLGIAGTNQDEDHESQLRSMIDTTGDLSLDERGYWDFHGGSSGAVFLRRMREQFGGLLGPHDAKTPFLPRPPRYHALPLHGSPVPSDSPFESGLPNTVDLPSKTNARFLCNNSLTYACALLRFVHEPSFYAMLDRIYDTPVEEFGDEENRYLPLLYVVLALGCMFTTDKDNEPEPSYKASIEQGVKYFQIARNMMDITDCRDMTSLHAILFMILFLQSSSNLSTCYSYIGIALRSALRMGLHRNLPGNFSLIEREMRRRIFWIIRKMDTYVAALLGFPRTLDDDDIDQVLPLEVDDEYITEDAILPMPPGQISLLAASNAHTGLMVVLAKVIKIIYPIKGVDNCLQSGSSPSYVISHAKIREVERDLQDWLEKLPMTLRPGGEASDEVVRVKQLLRMAYAHVQMMLYRPFLHYVSQKSSTTKSLNDRSYACAAAGVSVSRNIVHITVEMQRRGLLIGAYWFSMYTTFFAVLSLAFFVFENPGKPGTQEILADANAGRDCLKSLARRSLAADRCSTALNGLFEQLPAKLSRHRPDPSANPKKKRSASSLNRPAHVMTTGAHASPDTSIPALSKSQRATTFPMQLDAGAAQSRHSASSSGSREGRQSGSFEIPRNYPAPSASDQNLRQRFQELVSPPQISTEGTPESSSSGTGNSNQMGQQFQFQGVEGVPDLGAMMFPSADPFAYPNQPMFELDNRKNMLSTEMNINSLSNMYMDGTADGNGGGSGGLNSPFDNIEGQLFGPLPPYLLQNGGATQYDMNQMMPGINLETGMGHSGLTPGLGVGFEGNIFESADGWNGGVYRQ